MSLTLFIKNDKELRDKIKSTFLCPKLDKSMMLLAEPLTKRYGLVGTAFDYIFRFYLERLNNSNNTSKIWVAEQAIERLKFHKEKYEIGIKIINSVKEHRKEFIKTGELSKELIRQTLRMSYLDPVFRAGQGVEYIGTDADIEDVNDIENLFLLVKESMFKAENICILNPTFGQASRYVGGADADIIIDNKLIDIKTTKKLEFTLNYFCQIIGYLILHRISGIDGEKEKIEINQLGVYYSRFGYLFLFNVEDIVDSNSLQEFTTWFENKIK